MRFLPSFGLAGWCALAGALAPAQGELPFRLLELSGTPYERGLQHGEELRAEIAEVMAGWKADLAERVEGDADEWLAQFLARTSFDGAVRRHCPGLLDEVRGIAAGSGQRFEDVFAIQLIDEQWVAFMDGRHCTTFGVDAGDGRPAIVAQNLDIPPWMHRWPTVLRIRHSDSGLQSHVVTLPGLIGANGLNNARIAVGVNTILQIAPSKDGLPVAFVVRGLLEQPDHSTALAFLHRVKHASGQAYTVGGPETAPCFECSAAGAARFDPFAGRGFQCHTNHPLASRDYAPWLVKAAKDGGHSLDEVPWSCPRIDHAESVLSKAEAVDLDLVLGLLRSREGAVTICNDHTYACTVMLLGPRPELRVGFGPPDSTPLTSLFFD